MKKIYSLLIATFFLLVACEKDEIQMWDSGNYVQFMEEYKDSLTYSFFFYGTQEEIKVPLNIRLIQGRRIIFFTILQLVFYFYIIDY